MVVYLSLRVVLIFVFGGDFYAVDSCIGFTEKEGIA